MDLGTYQVKAGYAGEDTPKYVFPSAVGKISDANNMDTDGGNANGTKGLFVGTQSVNIRRDNMEIISPFDEHGVLSDWDAVEALWSHAFKDQMRVNPEGHPIMMAEPTHNSRAAREKMVELLFEKYKAPAVFLAKNAVLSSFAVGRQTSLVVDCGHNGTTGKSRLIIIYVCLVFVGLSRYILQGHYGVSSQKNATYTHICRAVRCPTNK